MPLGVERINARRKQPNDRITFIKPLEGPDKSLAEDFLERIAAICNPIMKEHHISIMSLEEYEPNLEFVGRNFNAGEVIQLVLKTPRTGAWLPFEYVQMVMMHELAHCKQMNHSGAFWKVRNAYAGQLRELWGRGYTGEGLWSRGITLVSGQYQRNSFADGEILPQHLCGGTFRSSGKRKRKMKEKLSYKERQARRVFKKFGTNGMALGADEDTKVKLEKGKKMVAKPRVAGSARGRDLRAAAALARFETKKQEPEVKEEDKESSTDSEDDDASMPHEAVDIDGKKLLDINGRGMIKVCVDEDKDDSDARNELSELRNFNGHGRISSASAVPIPKEVIKAEPRPSIEQTGLTKPNSLVKREELDDDNALKVPPQETGNECPVCSMENHTLAPTCMACAHVLHADKVPSVWRCRSETCRVGVYVNAGDCGLCGVCGARKCSDGT